MRDAQGRPEAVLAINTDVTEKKRLQAEVALAQRMDSLGTLAGGIAHDFNNLLSAIIGHLRLAARELPPEDRARQRLETVRAAADRATDLVKQILTFSRRHEPRRAPTRLQPIVEEALKLLRSTLPAMIRIRTQFAPEACDVLADASQVHQVVMNLGTNAAHAMGSHGLLEVKLAPVTLAERLAGIAGEAPPGRYMRLTVRDNGCGMDEATITRIFDPFFTTKEAGRGTGLGLSVVLGIVKDHGGELYAWSTYGNGSTFTLELPIRHEVEAEEVQPVRASEGNSLRGKQILVIDDEIHITELISDVLVRQGARIDMANSGTEGFEHVKKKNYDVIICDQRMPGLSGQRLYRLVEALNPELRHRFLFATGDVVNSQTRKFFAQAGVQYIRKPFRIQELVEAIENVLNRTQPQNS